ncbi:hypothetical protein ABMA28_001200 [Loxostege sticticalis]|uniref:HAT C-terminal dimerisation domain-containing protein n=1 Tax=Loxostege sticticalis TaxID=481309 RepID=A0ABD0T5C6_LOXSC
MDKFLISSTSRQEKRRNINDDCDSSSTMHEKPLLKKQKQQRDFNEKWLTDITFKNWISKREQECGMITAYCKVCDCTVLNHKPALVKHMNTSKHVQNISSKSHTTPIQQMMKPKPEDELKKRAELKICAFLAQHNLSFSLVDDLIPFLKNTFTDSDTIKSIELGRTKATNTIKTVLGPILTQELVEKLKKTPFSIIMDETTDISVKKQCALTVIYYDEIDCVRTQFLDIYEVESGKAEDLCNNLLTWLQDRQIPLKNFVGFASDTTNSMVGEHHSVFSHLKLKVPHIACIKCSCHMIHLVAAKACLKLPRSVEDLLRSIGAHFSRSTKRQNKLKEFQDFFKVDIHKILSPATTRWLSLEACVNRTLEQYQVLGEYFKLEVFEDPSKVTEDILTSLNNRFTKIYLEFMSYILNLFNDFNRLFQSEKPLLHQLKPEVHKLIKTIASNYMDFNYCKTTDAYKIEYANPRFYLPLEKIYLGVAAQASINEFSTEIPPTQIADFRKTCLSFYIEALSQIRKRFSFEDPLFDLLENVLNPIKAQKFEVKDLSSVIKRFPNIETDTENLHKEWKKHAFLDFNKLNISPDLPVEEYWNKILQMRDGTGEPMFPNLKEIIMVLLVLPFSNACVERVFSQLKLIKSDNRNRLNTDTIAALMATKAAVKNATKFEPSKALMHARIKYSKERDNDGEGRYLLLFLIFFHK